MTAGFGSQIPECKCVLVKWGLRHTRTHDLVCVCVYTRNNRAKKKPISTKTQFFSRRTKNKKLYIEKIYRPFFLDGSSADTSNVLKVSATCNRYPVPEIVFARTKKEKKWIRAKS
jgi:hypothetical protein